MLQLLDKVWRKLTGANDIVSESVTDTFSRRLRLHGKAADENSLVLPVERWEVPSPSSGEVLVEIAAAGVNPSDVKAAIGMMPHAVFPRTPGRDFSGIVVAGEADLIGQEVFGSSGDLGIRRDGTHATHLIVEAAGVVRRPLTLSAEEAAGIGVPFVTAMEGYRRVGQPEPGDTVLVLGVNGKVGQAAAQIAGWFGARVIGVVRKPEPYRGHSQTSVEVIDASSVDVAARVMELTDGKGANVVFNTVGEPYYESGTKSLAILGRQIFIASIRAPVTLDIFALYRGRHTFTGIDTLALSTIETAEIIRTLLPGFESGALKPFPITTASVYQLSDAAAAYAAVLGSARERIVLNPKARPGVN